MSYNSSVLSLLETNVRNVNDTLVTLDVLELFYEWAQIQHSTGFLMRTTFLQVLTSMISNASVGSILRTRAMMIIGRLMSRGNVFMFTNESSIRTVISAIDGRLRPLESQNADEFEGAFEALGQIGGSLLSVRGEQKVKAKNGGTLAKVPKSHGRRLSPACQFGRLLSSRNGLFYDDALSQHIDEQVHILVGTEQDDLPSQDDRPRG
ncbi:hypothetical protein U1Q18_025584 [Sarracenia purpurea var. burkii]